MSVHPVRLVFEGEFGCFTRPEFAAERYSYDVPPPTAARGMVEMIYWKPQIRYRILSVGMLPHSSGAPTRFMRITTNEVGPTSPGDVAVNRQQRRCMILRNPAFLVDVLIEPGSQPITKPGHSLLVHREILMRRVSKGQCVETPSLGMRDYPSLFRLARPDDVPLDENRPLGPMTYLIWRHDNWPDKAEQYRTTQMAALIDGCVDMSEWPQ
jgi:CRISPR-associated protein Cas5d